MRYWFTGDWHLWHERILALAGRNFPSIDAHNRTIQDNINELVAPKDHLVVLGDVAFGNVDRLSKWLDGLRCKNLSLVYGNHDDTVKRLVKREPKRFRRVGDILDFKLPKGHADNDYDVHIVCCHYAMRVWNKSHNGSFHLYGHSHGTLEEDPSSRSMDVGVDTCAMGPHALKGILAHLDSRPVRPVDKHKGFHHIPNSAVCGLCGNYKDEHQIDTYNCPLVPVTTTGNNIVYHATQYFAPELSYKRTD